MITLKGKALLLPALALFIALPGVVFAAGAADTASATEPLEITYMIRPKSGEPTTWMIEQIEEKFNVRIVPNGVDMNDGEKLAAILATGDLPDVIPGSNVFQLYADGLTRSFTRQMIQTNMPNFTRRLNTDYPTGWLTYRVPGKTDEYLAITGISESTDVNLWYLSFRADWAEKVGMPIRSFETRRTPMDRYGRVWFVDEQMTIDQFERLLVAFRDKDPDGNGKNDTIPFGALKYFNYSWNPILGAFGIGYNFNHMENGRLVQWNISDGYKQFLQLVQRWYNMGLVDREFTTMDFGPGWDKVKNQVVAATTVMTDYADMEYALDRPPNSLATLDQVAAGAAVAVVPPLKGPSGFGGANTYTPVGPVGNYPWAMSSKVSDEKAAKMMQIMDWMRLGEAEQWVNAQFGKEGVHFDWQAEPYNSAGIPRAPDQIPAGYPKTGDLGSVYPAYYTKDRLAFLYPKDNINFKLEWLFGEGRKYEIRPYRWDFFSETNLSDVNRRVGATLGTMVDEYMFKAMTGAVDIDATWDQYVSSWRSAGGQEILAELGKAPLVSELRKGNVAY